MNDKDRDNYWEMIRHYGDQKIQTLKFSTTITAGILTVATTIYVLRYKLEYPLFKESGFPASTDLPIMPFLYRTMTALFLLGWFVTSISLLHMLYLQRASLFYWKLIGINGNELNKEKPFLNVSSLIPISDNYLKNGLFSPFIESGLTIIGESALLFAAGIKTGSSIIINGGISESDTFLTFLLFLLSCLLLWIVFSRRTIYSIIYLNQTKKEIDKPNLIEKLLNKKIY